MKVAFQTVVPHSGATDRSPLEDDPRVRRLERELDKTRVELRIAREALGDSASESRTTDQALRWADGELRLIFDHVPVAIMLCSVGGSVIDANVAARDWFGVSDLTLPGEPYYRYVPESCRDRVRAADQKVIDRGDKTISDVHRLDIPGQRSRWVRTARVPFRHQGSGESMLLLVSEDCTEHSEEELRAEFFRSRMELALKASNVGIRDQMLTSGQTFWSERLKEIMGLPPTFEPTRGDFKARVHPADIDRVRHIECDHASSGQPRTVRMRIVRPNGEIRWIASSGQVYERDGVPDRFTGTVVDETETTEREHSLRRAHDELERSNEELSRFGHVCSHDMKEPVRMIESMSALLLEDGMERDPAQARQLLERINANTVRLRTIIDSLLAYSCVDACIESGPVELERVMADVRDNLACIIAEKGATLESGVLPIVTGARVHFLQLLQNLVGNALAYADSNSPRVQVHARCTPDETVLFVEDNGPGIAPADRERIFAMFSRLEPGSSVEGTGLGLSICQRIVQQHGGTIACLDSELGGVAFRIALPVGAQSAQACH